MRYEDASSSFSQAAGAPDARDDADALAAGSRGPATGNTITGAGTITGTAGADIVTNGPGQIVALEGAGGSDTGEGGSLHVAGRFGELTMDSRGGYSYEPSSDSPNGGVDVFRYTLADGAGARDTATLTIEIGRDLEEVKADAQQIIPGPDGVVTLPPGVELSDIQVVGRNLVITLPDGSQMVIIDGAVFVPQLVLGGVEVPASNLAALLIDAEPKPAAGTPLSSGGNFAVDVPPLDPGVPLGDLIPPTELAFPEPTFDDVGQFVDEEPEILIQPDGQPASVAAVDSVDEAGLPARPVNEPAGSDSAANSETTTGTILINSPDDPSVVTINGVAVTAVGQVFVGAHGTLTITSISDTAIGYSYTLTDNTSGDATHDDFSVTVTDNDGDTATATLTINIIDDVPTARPDTDSIAAGEFGPATGNVITDAAPGDTGDSDTNAADTVGADNATVTSISGAGGSDSTFSEGVLTVNGQYGVLTIDAQGNYSYVRNENTPGGVTDTFNYTLTDGDGDTSSSTLTIDIADLPVTVGQNPVARTDDDAVPGADGNPGGTGDDIDAENLSGTLSGSGGDGALTFDLLTTGAPEGFTYVNGPDGSILVQQGGTTVLTITVNAGTGAYTVTQNAPIDHPAGSDENNLSFTINYTVTDLDGDSAPGTLVINVDDDTPVIGREDVSAPTLTVDETDLATNATGNFSTLFAVDYGADGAGTTVFAVSVVNGTDSGLVDVATGQSIFLFNNNGVVEGRVGGVDGAVAFTVSVDSGTGIVTLDQVRALDHPDTSDHDDPVSPTATSIQLTVAATDGDGDPVNLSINIGGSLVFEDDGPSINANGTQPTLTVDETVLATNATANFAGVFSASFGADGAGSVAYSLGINAGATGLVDTATGLAVVLTVEGSQVVGRAGPAGPIVFTVSVDADGNVTLDQQRAVVHDDPSDHDEATSPATLAADNLITLNATVTDGDGDTATATANIGQNLNFEDDGPSLSNVVAASGVTLDETSAGSPDGFPIFLTSGAAMISATQAFGADGAAAAGSVVYGVSLTGDVASLASGLQTAIGDFPITLVQVDADTIQGQYQDGGTQVAFTVQMNADGTVTLTQEVPLEHLVDGPEGPAHDDPLNLSGLINATITIKDGDGDTATGSAAIGGNLVFEDDGPSITAGTTQPTLAVDETVLATNATASFAGVFSADYGADGPAAANAIVYTLGVNAGATGIVDTATNEAVVLTVNGSGQVEGRTATSNLLVFVVSVDGDGNVTLDQQRAVVHNDPADHDEPGASAVTLAADNLITLTKTVTDGDGDSDSATANIGQNLQFEDDGPSAAVVTTGFSISHDETPGVQGDANDVAGPLAVFDSVANKGDDPHVTGTVIGFATSTGAIGSTGSVYGADGAGTTVFSLNVSSPGVDSGLNTTEGQDIFLFKEGDLVVGRVGNGAGPAAFALSIDPVTGQVSMVQYLSIQHLDTTSPDESVSITTGAILAVATVTDKDGDVSTASTGIGNLISFQDDAPQAIQPDAITEGLNNEIGGTATADLDDDGEVLTDFGADGPGLVTFANITNGEDSGLTSDEDTIEYFLTNNGQTLEARTNATLPDGSDGDLIFTVTINQADGDYTVTMFGTIDNGAGVSFNNLTSSKAGNVDVRGVGADDPLTTVDLLLTASANGANATINTSSTTVGSANQSMNVGETIRIDFVSNLQDDPDDDLATFPSGFSYDGHVGTDSFLQLIPQVQGDQSQTVAFRVYALNTTVTDAGSPDDIPGDGFSDSTIVPVTHVTVDGFDVGETPVTVAIGGIGVWTPIAYGVFAQLQADGSVIFTGIQEGDRYGIETGTDFNAIAVSSLATGIGPGVPNNSTTDAFDLGVFAIGEVDTGEPINLSYDLAITDGDGDTVTMVDAINITIDPAGTPAPLAASTMMVSQEALVDDSSSSMLMSSETNDQQLKSMSAANNNSVLLGAIAAAGLGVNSAAAAAHSVADSGVTLDAEIAAAAGVGAQSYSLDSGEASRSALGGETKEAVEEQSSSASSAGASAEAGANSLTGDGGSQQSQAPAALPQGTEAPQSAPADSGFTSASVGMPSAEMLAAANENGVEGAAKSNGEVGRVLADALAGGGNGPDIDAVLDAVASEGGQPALEALASHGAGAVSGWDTAAFAGFPGGQSAITMDSMTLHFDAVQPAA